jgi:hypothetical protein
MPITVPIDDSVPDEGDEPFVLPRLETDNPGLLPGVDLHDKEQLAELLADNTPTGG